MTGPLGMYHVTLPGTWIEVTQLSWYVDESDRPLKAHSQENKRRSGDSRRPRWRSWSTTVEAYIHNETHFKAESQHETYYDDPRNPTTGVLGMSNRTNT